MRRCLFVLLLFVFWGCDMELSEPEQDMGVEVDSNEVFVSFDVGYKALLKSSVSPDENVVKNMSLYAFSDGVLVASGYFEGDEGISLKLLYGHAYNIYALANVGKRSVPYDEAEFREACTISCGSMLDFKSDLPMVWSVEDYVVRSLSERVNIRFERALSKLLFRVDKSALNGLKINDVRVCQNPLLMWPFRWKDGSRVECEDDVLDGDYADYRDLIKLNSGEQVCFYLLENCQGRLLDDNDDPWAKVPENIPGRANLCTYLEVECSFADGSLYSGDIIYRIYLGQDSVSDFNVKRNSVLDVSLYLTEGALGRISWRVDADVSMSEDCVIGWMSKGLHSLEDLYVGERLIYTLDIDQRFVEYVDNQARVMSLCALGDDGHELIEFGVFEEKVGVDGMRRFDVEGLCLRPDKGTVFLKDDTGKVLATLDDVNVKKPFLRSTESLPEGHLYYIPADMPLMTLGINDRRYAFNIYLVDSEGCSLHNPERGLPFDFSLFDLDFRADDLDVDLAKSLDVKIWEESGQIEGRFAYLDGAACNKGDDKELNSKLVTVLNSDWSGNLTIVEKNFNIKTNVKFCFDYAPITLTLVDNGWAQYSDCQISMIVDNPSNLPIRGQCWQLDLVENKYNAISRNEILDQYGSVFTRKTYEYVCGDFSNGQMPLYCSCSDFSIVGSGVCHFPGISTTVISNAALYDYMSQDVLYHHIDAVFENGKPIYKMRAVDQLSDGSRKYEVVYGNDPDMDGWNDRGIWLYSTDSMLSKSGNDFDGLKGVCPMSLDALQSGKIGLIKVGYDAGNQCVCAYVDSPFVAGLQLNAEVTVKAEGYVQTTPNGTWGKKVDNYCSASVSKQVKMVTLGSTPSVIDGGAVKEAMEAIYSNRFFDSYNAIGSANSYNHCAHPISLEVNLNFSLADDSSYMMAPISVSLPSSVIFFHSQEGVNYSVPVIIRKNVNSMAFVEKLHL